LLNVKTIGASNVKNAVVRQEELKCELRVAARSFVMLQKGTGLAAELFKQAGLSQSAQTSSRTSVLEFRASIPCRDRDFFLQTGSKALPSSYPKSTWGRHPPPRI
jgi:hypothetical protein